MDKLHNKVEVLPYIDNISHTTYENLLRHLEYGKQQLTYEDLYYGRVKFAGQSLSLYDILLSLYDKISSVEVGAPFTVKPQYIVNKKRCKNLDIRKVQFIDFIAFITSRFRGKFLVNNIIIKWSDIYGKFHSLGLESFEDMLREMRIVNTVEIRFKNVTPDTRRALEDIEKVYKRIQNNTNPIVSLDIDGTRILPEHFKRAISSILPVNEQGLDDKISEFTSLV